MRPAYILSGFIGLVILVVVGVVVYQRFSNNQMSQEITVQPETASKQPLELIKPQLTYDNAYNGPLYTTSEKLGSEAPFEQYFANLDRNGVTYTIIYFGIEKEEEFAKEDIEAIKKILPKYPGRVVPFFSPGMGAQETMSFLGDQLVSFYRSAFSQASAKLGTGTLKGIGEIEMHDWQIPHNDPKLLSLFAFASENKLQVMFHIRPGQMDNVRAVLSEFPNTKFLAHMYREDFLQEREHLIKLMRDFPNIFYTIDVDHLLYDGRTGLLYKFEDQSAAKGAKSFIGDFEANFQSLLEKAVLDYQPLIEAHPDRVTLGTEMSTDYTFEPEVYDRIIKFTRFFIGRLSPELQQSLAYQNALAIFGSGVNLQ